MDVVLLSRIQFALNVAFHYLYPPLSIGLGLVLVIMEGMYMKTKNPKYKKMVKFWVKIFALTFALGVATGIVMVFAFGSNWARYSRFVGDVFGSALAAEGIFAFFLEAGFLGVLLFGWNRVSEKMHFISTICVAFGAHFSAIWITVANSWMQTPAGFKIVGEGAEARAVVTDFWAMIFNPSSLQRICHVVLGCWLTGAFLVLSISAFYMLKKRHVDFARSSMKVGLWVAGVSLILQLISADITARGVARHQPEKLAAAEGIYQTNDYTPMTLFGWVDAKEKQVRGLKVPGLLSFLVYRSFKPAVTGLDQYNPKDLPNVPVVFQTYHLMILMWVFMVFVVLFGLFFWKKKNIEKAKWTLRAMVISVAFPYIANQTGWFTAEMGRQPWIVYHILRTPDGVSKSVVASQVLSSIIMFSVIYIALFILFIYLLNHKIQYGPEEEGERESVYSHIYPREASKQEGRT
ncbi:MAG: cytochrome ubiquinol oxidase subunit I [Simkaniaceae bacterium]